MNDARQTRADIAMPVQAAEHSMDQRMKFRLVSICHKANE